MRQPQGGTESPSNPFYGTLLTIALIGINPNPITSADQGIVLLIKRT
jgi:hypothetical protein